MPPCNKVLGLYHNKSAVGKYRVMQLRCVLGEGHPEECQFHVWTDGQNKATGQEGVIRTIVATKI